VTQVIVISSLRLKNYRNWETFGSAVKYKYKFINCFRFVENLASDIFQECNGISVKVLNLQKLVIVRMRKRRRLRKNEKVKV
jgi:hypothetical protein